MPKLIWKKWFPQDWKSDPKLSRCSPTTRGIWADSVCSMMQSDDYKIEGTNSELARDCRCSEADIESAHQELERTKTADVTEQNGIKKWECRRLKKENKISQVRSLAGKKSGESRNKTTTNIEHAERTPSASASAYASDSEIPTWNEFWEYCQSPQCGIAAEWFAKDKYLSVDDWSKKRDWRKFALRVRGWWDNDGRPMKPPQKNGSDAGPKKSYLQMPG